MSRTSTKKFPRVGIPKPTKPHKIKKGAKPKHPKRDSQWDGDQFYDNFIDGNRR